MTKEVVLEDCKGYNETCGIDLIGLRKIFLPQNCDDFIKEFEYLDRPYNCSEFFVRKQTEAGQCFVANSLDDAPKIKKLRPLQNFKTLPLKHSNLEKVRRRMMLRFTESDVYQLRVFVHSPDEMADAKLEHIPKNSKGSYVYHAIKTIEMINQDDVIDETIEDRQCRFPSEKIEEFDLHYSPSNCQQYVRMKREHENCGCVMDIGAVPKHLKKCSIEKLVRCIGNSKLNPVPKSETNCTLPSCLSMEISVLANIERQLNNELGTIVIEVVNMPTLKYVRRVKESRLDRMGMYTC